MLQIDEQPLHGEYQGFLAVQRLEQMQCAVKAFRRADGGARIRPLTGEAREIIEQILAEAVGHPTARQSQELLQVMNAHIGEALDVLRRKLPRLDGRLTEGHLAKAGNVGPSENHRSQRRSRPTDAHLVPQIMAKGPCPLSQLIDITEQLEAAADLEYHARRRRHQADPRAEAVQHFGQQGEPVEFALGSATIVPDPGGDAVRGGQRAAQPDASLDGCRITQHHPAIVDHHQRFHANTPGGENLQRQQGKMHPEPQHQWVTRGSAAARGSCAVER